MSDPKPDPDWLRLKPFLENLARKYASMVPFADAQEETNKAHNACVTAARAAIAARIAAKGAKP
ncbi:MAG: hypothetical protein ACYC6M_03030 [Terriglobales bacterium]